MFEVVTPLTQSVGATVADASLNVVLQVRVERMPRGIQHDPCGEPNSMNRDERGAARHARNAGGHPGCSAPRRRAAVSLNPVTEGDVQCSKGGRALQRSWPDTEQGIRVVCRRGLLGIEGLAIRVRFDPDRPTQRTVLTALTGRRCQLVLEVLKPLKSGSGLNHANDLDVALHRVSLLGPGTRCCSIGHRAHRETDESVIHVEAANRPTRGDLLPR
jgi:hypothetical protein